MAGLWYEIQPRRLRPSRNASNWVFAEYLETPSEREDGQWFRVYLFRDVKRQMFGALVHLGRSLPKSDPRDWATKIVRDEEFRERHLTSDADLIALWNRR
jgi:hypothetical protein